MTDFDDLVTRYLTAWNAPDDTARSEQVARVWTDDATFTDPLADLRGHDEISGFIGAVRQKFPGCTFRARPGIDGHHDVVRFGWELVPDGGGEPPVVGLDVAVVAADGRIRAVHGFFDRVPAPTAT